MKKIFILILICVVKLSAYEYIIYDRSGINIIYYDSENKLRQKFIQNGIESTRPLDTNLYFQELNFIRHGTSGYIGINEFNSYLKNDLYLLNGFYTTTNNTLQSILNYYYNENNFTESNYIQYEDYELLYNSDGLVVESIVNGVWAGLYSDEEKDISGKLYSVDGQLLYNNGEEVDWFGALFDKLTGGFDASVDGCFYVFGNCVKYIVMLFLVWMMFYLILRMSKTIFK